MTAAGAVAGFEPGVEAAKTGVSAVIPVLNEEEAIGGVIGRISRNAVDEIIAG